MRRPFILLPALLLAACNGPAAPAGTDYQELPADMVTVGMRYYSTEGDRRTAELRADTAYEFQDSAGYSLRGVDLKIFDESTGQQTATLTSERGTFNRNTESMIARGNVVLVTSDGYRIETPELLYDPAAGRMESDSTSVIIQDGERTTARDGFIATGVQGGRIGNVRLRRPTGSVGLVIF
ncbi:MAG: LPS export ABC transporter periplasmic protein LptC [Gemmatimonadota bacterium]